MNIFALSFDPMKAAHALCDKHIPKMVLETAQLLCGAFPEGTAPYKRTHYNHPCAKWVRESPFNYAWLVQHGLELAREYERRFGREHASVGAIVYCQDFAAKEVFAKDTRTADFAMTEASLHNVRWRGFTEPFAQAMPEQYRHHNPVTAYRAYYIGEKARFAKWERGRKPPPWWPKEK